MKLLDGVVSRARLSDDREYRYFLSREWGDTGAGYVLWLMLNPSTASAEEDDPTIRKCQKFARTWGYDGIVVGNLFALRSSDPEVLRKHPNPVGPENDQVLDQMLRGKSNGLVICAWGAHRVVERRAPRVLEIARQPAVKRKLHALGFTLAGQPRHPLYMKDNALPVEYR